MENRPQGQSAPPNLGRMAPTGQVDIAELVQRMARRRPDRTEANVQSDLHTLLIAAGLNLGDAEIDDVILESPAGARRRIDVEVGSTIFEVKRDLRAGNVLRDAIEQLTGYVQSRTENLGRRYVGVLTDGADWRLYHLVAGQLEEVASISLSETRPNVTALCDWLEGVLATLSRVRPLPSEIERRLGAASSAHALDFADLAALYRQHQSQPTVALKRELWAKLLTTAFGTAFADEEQLFIEHTLLVLTSEIIAHAVVGLDLADPTITPATLVTGGLFAQAQIWGVIEADFFDWVIEVPGGETFVRSLAQRLSRFDWSDVQHDVMKVLYESVIGAKQRHDLGEYYTPDWLAERLVEHTVGDPLSQRVLDPACGSGTFLFHAVRRYLETAKAAGQGVAEAITGAVHHVTGIDVHPVAVTLARVTYLLAIGMDNLRSADRPPIAVPVYLGDSVQWGQERSLLSADDLVVTTDEGAQLFATELRFPAGLLADADRFDRLISDLADKAAARPAGAKVPSLVATFRRYVVPAGDQGVVTRTFETMCALHDQGRNHIWGYYVRNLARPAWLAQHANRVDVLVGNPPWLAYRYMTEAMKVQFQAMSRERGLWAGAAVATNQDLSGLFVTRTVELYLRTGGSFAYLMPLAALSRRQFAGFRTGSYPVSVEPTAVAFDTPWDLHAVKPSFFPVPTAAVLGRRTAHEAGPMPGNAEGWVGKLPRANLSWSEASDRITRAVGAPSDSGHGQVSEYAARFSQGATIVPRFMFFVDPAPASPLGAGAGRKAVRSRRSANEKRPWKDLAQIEGSVESQFLWRAHLGETVLPYRLHAPLTAVIPWDGKRLLSGGDDRLDLYPGLAAWWREAEKLWEAHRSSDALSLLGQLDYRHKLSDQFPVPPHRVTYSASGMYLAAARISDPGAVVEHQLYWGTASTADEADFIVAILNSNTVTRLVAPLQARGEHNPRHFDKYIFQLPIPLFDPDDARHVHLVGLSRNAEQLVADLELPTTSFQSQRRRIRQALDAGVGQAIDEAVEPLLQK
jgi:SAM-dependent methyltransferase